MHLANFNVFDYVKYENSAFNVFKCSYYNLPYAYF